jgi:hypothetical protein
LLMKSPRRTEMWLYRCFTASSRRIFVVGERVMFSKMFLWDTKIVLGWRIYCISIYYTLDFESPAPTWPGSVILLVWNTNMEAMSGLVCAILRDGLEGRYRPINSPKVGEL